MMMKIKSQKEDKTPQIATKTYAYGGRVANGSMEKPEKRQMDAMAMKPREPYTTKEAEEERKKQAMSPMLAPILRMIG